MKTTVLKSTIMGFAFTLCALAPFSTHAISCEEVENYLKEDKINSQTQYKIDDNNPNGDVKDGFIFRLLVVARGKEQPLGVYIPYGTENLDDYMETASYVLDRTREGGIKVNTDRSTFVTKNGNCYLTLHGSTSIKK